MASEENFEPMADEEEDFFASFSPPMDIDDDIFPDDVASCESSNAGDTSPTDLQETFGCLKGKYNSVNKFLYKDWKLYKKIPVDIFGPADAKKEKAVCHRVAVTPKKFPVFDIVGGLKPYSWKHNLLTFLKEIILKNKCCYPMKCRTITEEKKLLYASSTNNVELNQEQKNVVSYIQWLKEHTFNEKGSLSTIIIQGRAGSGKTSVLQDLVNIGVVAYISIGQILCSDVKRKFPTVSVYSVCSFLMSTLKVDYYTTIGIIGELLKHLNFDFLENVEIELKGTLSIFAASKEFFIFFIDEFSLMTDGLLGLLYKIFDYFSINHKLNIVLIFAGDSNQINPRYQIMKAYNFRENSMITEKMNARMFYFNSQHRFNDVEYDEFLLKFNKSNNVKDIIKNYFQDQTNTILYNYPYEVISKMPEGKGDDVCNWLYQNVEILTPPLVLGYSNRELHFNNLSLAQKIYHELKIHTSFDNLNMCKFLTFDVPNIKYGPIEKMKTIPQSFSPGDPFLVTPLIKGLPYKILSYQKNIPRLSIVYLLSIETEYISVFSMVDNTILHVYPRDFQSNLFPRVTFIGFPVQLLFGETFYSSQGLTLNRDIYANLNGASKSEMYVALSRSKTVSNYKSVLLQ